ncbi:MAG: DUF134 domain-containing protein [Ignavibacteriae bacterium]|nr:DUF134 domain-containing protein [Ignavibacteriota bacterium]
MARPIKPRKLLLPHKEISFIPEKEDDTHKEIVTLLSEEYEVIKLVDYENMNHLQAAKVLKVSRPTLTRIYQRARKKIAESLVELKILKLGGGNSYLVENWYTCNDCETIFNIPKNIIFKYNCPVCSGKSIQLFSNNNI